MRHVKVSDECKYTEKPKSSFGLFEVYLKVELLGE